jgi:hypothetical protein
MCKLGYYTLPAGIQGLAKFKVGASSKTLFCLQSEFNLNLVKESSAHFTYDYLSLLK